MKSGIFIPGLGEAFQGTTLKNYAKRLANEMDYANEISMKYYTKEEKFDYGDECSTNCITIYSNRNQQETREYRLYDFTYSTTLTKEFREKSVLSQCLLLFKTVIFKSPIAFGRLFRPNQSGYQSGRLRLLSFYTFGIFFIMALAGIVLIPAALTLLEQVFKNEDVHTAFKNHEGILKFLTVVKKILLAIVSMVLIGFTFLPNVQSTITALATEFCCVDSYLDYGLRRQAIGGQLDALIEFVAEKELEACAGDDPVKLHLHAYSFGSILALDQLYPFGSNPSVRIKETFECLITIGCPYEFIASYYPKYFGARNTEVSLLKWYNVLSVADALSSNFRNDAQATPASYSFCTGCQLPENIQYELSPADPAGFWNFVSLYSVKAHQFYWNRYSGGQSCLNVVHERMVKDGLF